MEFHMKLPRTTREFIAFMLIISLLSVNIIAPLITMFEVESFSLEVRQNVLKILPFIWITVIILVLATQKPAQRLTNKIIKPTDSFNAHMVINTLCNVLLMSVILTVVATRIGTGEVSTDAFTHFFYRRPRNFGISFGVEALLAQPIARWVLHRYHKKKDKK
ncbi:MAG: hypothetical protein LBO09_02095 [Candidatus Peribacteria bacterium]|jgi:hypothetical protein|nr:hypothetical protein [Candidatus Peribacteria bacterium]